MHTFKVPAIIAGVVMSAVVMGGTFMALNPTSSQASSSEPKNVSISNITQTRATLNWTTDQEVLQNVEYGTSPDQYNLFLPESARTKNHSLDLTLLNPGTTYYVRIRFADEVFTSGGVPWSFTTKAAGGSDVVSGVKKGCAFESCEDIKKNLGNGCSAIDLAKKSCE
jgi:hypothetical protein